MSSILDALRKLEKNTDDEKDPGFVWPHPVDSKDALSKRLRRGVGITPLIGVFLLTFVVGGSLLVFWDTKKMDIMENSANTESSTASTSNTPAVGNMSAPVPGGENKPVQTGDVSRPETQNPHVYEKDTAGNGSDTGNDTKDDTYGYDSDTNTKQSASEAKAPPMDKDTAAMMARIPKSMIPPQKIVDSRWLTLQAISWSNDPATRIAVINSQIVKEGRQVDGGLIVRIDRDYVVIEKDGEQQMLPFNHH